MVKACLTCPYYYFQNGKYHCRKIETERTEICWSCSQSLFNPAKECLIEKFDAYAKLHPVESSEAVEKTEPVVKLKCCECGTIKELPETEYLDKRKRKKYEPTSYCEKCNWITEHQWVNAHVRARSMGSC